MRNKRCADCGLYKLESEFPFSNRSANRRISYCKACWNRRGAVYRAAHPDYSKRSAQYYRDLKDGVITAYGHRCACCGETVREFLTLNHVNNNGAAHRRETHSNAHYVDAKRRNYPPEYNVLCFNCNCSQAHGEPCAHETERQLSWVR